MRSRIDPSRITVLGRQKGEPSIDAEQVRLVGSWDREGLSAEMEYQGAMRKFAESYERRGEILEAKFTAENAEPAEKPPEFMQRVRLHTMSEPEPVAPSSAAVSAADEEEDSTIDPRYRAAARDLY